MLLQGQLVDVFDYANCLSSLSQYAACRMNPSLHSKKFKNLQFLTLVIHFSDKSHKESNATRLYYGDINKQDTQLRELHL